jgi:hypothetical protein
MKIRTYNFVKKLVEKLRKSRRSELDPPPPFSRISLMERITELRGTESL